MRRELEVNHSTRVRKDGQQYFNIISDLPCIFFYLIDIWCFHCDDSNLVSGSYTLIHKLLFTCSSMSCAISEGRCFCLIVRSFDTNFAEIHLKPKCSSYFNERIQCWSPPHLQVLLSWFDLDYQGSHLFNIDLTSGSKGPSSKCYTLHWYVTIFRHRLFTSSFLFITGKACLPRPSWRKHHSQHYLMIFLALEPSKGFESVITGKIW